MNIINNNKKRMEKSKMIAVSIKPSEHMKLRQMAITQKISVSELLISNTLRSNE